MTVTRPTPLAPPLPLRPDAALCHAGGLFKAWHKTTSSKAGDGLADLNGRDGNGHLIVNDKDIRWQQAQQRGEAPMYTAVHKRIEEYFQMRIQGKRYNHYRDDSNWKRESDVTLMLKLCSPFSWFFSPCFSVPS